MGGRRCDVVSQNIIYSTYREEQRVLREGTKRKTDENFFVSLLSFIGCERPERYSFTARKFLFLEALFRPCVRSVLASVPSLRPFRPCARSVLAPVPLLCPFRCCARSAVVPVPLLRPFRPDAAPISRSFRHSGCMAGMPGRRRRGPIHRFWKSGAGPVRQSPVFPGLYTNRRVST